MNDTTISDLEGNIWDVWSNWTEFLKLKLSGSLGGVLLKIIRLL